MNENYKDNDILCYLHLMYNNNAEEIFYQVWADQPIMARHFFDKYMQFYEDYGCTGAPAPFFCSLSPDHQRRLTAFARNYYNKQL